MGIGRFLRQGRAPAAAGSCLHGKKGRPAAAADAPLPCPRGPAATSDGLYRRPAQAPQWTNTESSPRLRHTSPPAARRTARGSSGSPTIPTGAGTSTGGRATPLRGGATGLPTPRTTPARPSGTFQTGERRANPAAPEAQATSMLSRTAATVANCRLFFACPVVAPCTRRGRRGEQMCAPARPPPVRRCRCNDT